MLGAKNYRLVITSVTGALFDGDVQSAILPGSAGEMTILANHEPLVTTLSKGNITVHLMEGETKTFAIESGVVECSGNRVTVLL